MADRLVDAIVKMKMAGFVDASPTFNRPVDGLVDAPFAADLRPSVSPEDQRGGSRYSRRSRSAPPATTS
jgi:hypothetical protein